MDFDPSRTSDFYISTNRLDLPFLRRRRCYHWQTLYSRSRGPLRWRSLHGSLGLFSLLSRRPNSIKPARVVSLTTAATFLLGWVLSYLKTSCTIQLSLNLVAGRFVDQDFNFLAIIDWEFAQTAPWEVNHYPMPFPLISADAKIDCILKNPDHIAHRNVSRQVAARKMYRQKFRDAQQALESRGRSLQKSIADMLDGAASRIYAILEKFGVFEGMEEELTYEMARLAYGFNREEAKKYLNEMEAKMKGVMPRF